MTPKTSPTLIAGNDRARYWLLVHNGQVDSIEWDDGERLLALTTEVRLGSSKSQEFTFCPRGAEVEGHAVTVFVDRETPIELVSQYDNSELPSQSHWFG